MHFYSYVSQLCHLLFIVNPTSLISHSFISRSLSPGCTSLYCNSLHGHRERTLTSLVLLLLQQSQSLDCDWDVRLLWKLGRHHFLHRHTKCHFYCRASCSLVLVLSLLPDQMRKVRGTEWWGWTGPNVSQCYAKLDIFNMLLDSPSPSAKLGHKMAGPGRKWHHKNNDHQNCGLWVK